MRLKILEHNCFFIFKKNCSNKAAKFEFHGVHSIYFDIKIKSLCQILEEICDF